LPHPAASATVAEAADDIHSTISRPSHLAWYSAASDSVPITRQSPATAATSALSAVSAPTVASNPSSGDVITGNVTM